MLDVVILGAGISGLTTAYEISKGHSTFAIVEKSKRAGGLVQTLEKDGFLFDLGPNSIRTSGSGLNALKLALELNLENEIIYPSKDSLKRYILRNGKLKSPFFSKDLLLALLREPFVKRSLLEDESISSFFARRFSPKIVDTLVDALVTGIFAGDSTHLSMRSCFPSLFFKEKKHRSLLLSSLFGKKAEKPLKAPFFSFKKGMQTLINALQSHISDSLILGDGATRIEYNEGWTIQLESGKTLRAKKLISTLPLNALSPLVPEISCELPHASLAVVPLAFKSSEIDLKNGFGYLIPFQEGSPLLGVIFNGSIFPSQGAPSGTLKMTAMLGGMRNLSLVEKNPEEIKALALQELFKHLRIKPVTPLCSHVHIVWNAIPQYPVGYSKSLEGFEEFVKTNLPQFFYTGNAFHGVSIGDLSQQGQTVARKI